MRGHVARHRGDNENTNEENNNKWQKSAADGERAAVRRERNAPRRAAFNDYL